jgi:hypothetical protein
MRTTDGVTGGTPFGSAGSGSTAEALRMGAAFAGCPKAATPGQDGPA